MYIFRLFQFLLLLFCTAAGTCAIIFPLFRHDRGEGRKSQIFTFMSESESSQTPDNTILITRLYARNFQCDTRRTYFLVVEALSIGGTGLGAIALLLTTLHLGLKNKWGVAVPVLIMCFLSFLCFLVCIGTMGVAYDMGMCKNSSSYVVSYKDEGYKLVEGFALLCIACAGFLVATIIELFV